MNDVRAIEFAADSSLAAVVSDNAVALVDLTTRPLKPEMITLSHSLEPPRAEELVLSPDGRWGFLRQFEASSLMVLDLPGRGLEMVAVGENPTDLEDLYKRSRSEGFGAEVKRRILVGTYALSAGYYDAYYLKALKVRRRIRQDFDHAFENVDVIAGPVSPTAASSSLEEPPMASRRLVQVSALDLLSTFAGTRSFFHFFASVAKERMLKRT